MKIYDYCKKYLKEFEDKHKERFNFYDVSDIKSCAELYGLKYKDYIMGYTYKNLIDFFKEGEEGSRRKRNESRDNYSNKTEIFNNNENSYFSCAEAYYQNFMKHCEYPYNGVIGSLESSYNCTFPYLNDSRFEKNQGYDNLIMSNNLQHCETPHNYNIMDYTYTNNYLPENNVSNDNFRSTNIPNPYYSDNISYYESGNYNLYSNDEQFNQSLNQYIINRNSYFQTINSTELIQRDNETNHVVENAKDSKLFICDVHGCVRRYTSKGGLIYHIDEFHSEKNNDVKRPYICQIKDCQKPFKSKPGIKNHYKTQHNLDVSYGEIDKNVLNSI